MSDIFVPDETFRRTHELKALRHLSPGWTAECWCGYRPGYRRLAFFALMAHVRHRSKALKGLWR